MQIERWYLVIDGVNRDTTLKPAPLMKQIAPLTETEQVTLTEAHHNHPTFRVRQRGSPSCPVAAVMSGKLPICGGSGNNPTLVCVGRWVQWKTRCTGWMVSRCHCVISGVHGIATCLPGRRVTVTAQPKTDIITVFMECCWSVLVAW